MAGDDDDVTLVGEVEAEGVAAGAPARGWASLRVGGRVGERELSGALRVRLDDGEVVRVNVRAADGVLVPAPAPAEGRWRDVAGDPRAAIVLALAPGDHVEVELRGWLVPAGARVAVRGRASTAEDGRTIAARRIALVDLDRGVGGEATAFDALDAAERDARARELREIAVRGRATPAAPPTPTPTPKAPKVPVPWRWGAPICAALGAALAFAGVLATDDVVATIAAGHVPWGLAFTTSGALLLVVALAMWASRPLYEIDDTMTGDPTFHPTWAIGKAAFAAFTVQLMGGATSLPMAGGLHSRWWAASTWLPVIVTAGGLTIWLARRQRGALRLARLVLRAPAMAMPPASGAWGWFEGRVVADDAPLERTVRYVARAESHTVTERAQDGSMQTKTETTTWFEGHPHGSSMRPFEVALDGGVHVGVRGREVTWGAPTEFRPIGKGDHTGLADQTRMAVSPGDAIVVLGRLQQTGDAREVVGSGPEALLLFAAPADARGTLRRCASMMLATLGTLAAVTLGSLAIALATALA